MTLTCSLSDFFDAQPLISDLHLQAGQIMDTGTVEMITAPGGVRGEMAAGEPYSLVVIDCGQCWLLLRPLNAIEIILMVKLNKKIYIMLSKG